MVAPLLIQHYYQYGRAILQQQVLVVDANLVSFILSVISYNKP